MREPGDGETKKGRKRGGKGGKRERGGKMERKEKERSRRKTKKWPEA